MGELVASVPPADAMPLVLRPHPFSADSGVVFARPGQTIGEMLRDAAGDRELAPLEVRVGGYVVPVEMWDRLRPKQGTVIEVTGVPGSNMSSGWRAVLMIVVAIVAWWAAPYAAAAFGGSAGMWSSVFMMAGNLAINALVKPPQPMSGDGPKQWNQLTGNSNQINPGGPIPHVLGESRYFPPHAAMPYSVATGDHSYQYCLFDLGYNVEEDDLSDFRIGDTPVSNFDGVTIQIGTNPSLYRNDAAQTYIGVTLEEYGEIIRTTPAGSETISIDLVCPQGLYGINDTGQKNFAMDMFLDVQYRPQGTSAWLSVPNPRLAGGLRPNAGPESLFVLRALKKDPFTFGLAWDVPAGQYDVRVERRNFPPDDRNTYMDMVVLNSLLSVRQVPASRTGTLKLAMRIRADNQLNGTLQSFSLMAKPKYPVYDEGTDTWSRQRTTNAGWLYHYLLTSCPATLRRVPPERMNLPQILDFVDFCTLHELETRMVVDTSSTLGQVIDMLLRTSAGERTMTDGRYGVTFVPDSAPLAPAQYAPTEVRDFTMQRTFSRIPNALRVKFRNPMANWQDDEIIVLDDGYSYRGLDARGEPSSDPEAETFEELNLQATMLPQQAWRLGRMHFAQAKFAGATYSWGSDIAALKLTKGSACEVAHDVPEWGAGVGRVLSISAGGPVGAATIVLDADIETDQAKSYRMQIRSSSGVQAINCTPHSPRTGTFYLASIPSGVQPGDVGILGESGVEKPILLITHMRATPDLDFSVSAVAWDPRIAPFWVGPPEDMVSEISGQPYTDPPDPPDLVIGIIDEDDDAGINTPTFRFSNSGGGGKYIPSIDDRQIRAF